MILYSYLILSQIYVGLQSQSSLIISSVSQSPFPLIDNPLNLKFNFIKYKIKIKFFYLFQIMEVLSLIKPAEILKLVPMLFNIVRVPHIITESLVMHNNKMPIRRTL